MTLKHKLYMSIWASWYMDKCCAMFCLLFIHILRAATTVPFGCMVGGGFGLMSCCFCE